MVKLIDACFAAKVSYRVGLDALLRGDVAGEKRGGSWYADGEALRRYATQRRKPARAT